MEIYGNDLFLSQEGCPSLDLALLDHPSSSAVSAPGATVPSFPGETSFPSFDVFDGAEVESFDDRSFPGHRRHTSEPQKDATRRNASTNSGLVWKQMHGVHDFFGQDNQQQHMGLSSWSGMGSRHSPVESQYFLSGVGNAEDLSGQSMPMKDTLWGKTQSGLSGMSTGDGGFTFIQASKPLDDKRFSHEAEGTSIANQVRNQLGGALQYPSSIHNSASNFGNSLQFNNRMFEPQSTAEEIAIQSAPYQNQYDGFASQTPAGAALKEVQHLDCLANPLRLAQVALEPQSGGPPKGGGMTQLQSWQQTMQSKHEQALQSKQQHILRLHQQEVLRKKEATRVQQQEVVQLQQQEAVQMQQQDVMRMQQHERMQLQQHEMMKMQQREGMWLKQKEAMRKQQQEAMQLQQHETTQPQQQESMQQYEAMWSRQHDTMHSQQQAGMWPQSQDATQSQQLGAMQLQLHEVMQSQQQITWSRKQQEVWSQQGRLLESEQKKSMQPQGQNGWLSQQETWQPPEQVLPSQQQHTLRFALQSLQRQAWQSQQQQPLHPSQQQALHSQQQQALQVQQQQQQQQQALRTLQQQQALRMQQRQQAFQIQRQQALEVQQQQASPFQQHSRNQLQELSIGQQLNQQREHSGLQHFPQETCTEFLGTSYSALLHGPDTPPSQPQLAEEPVLSELEDHTAAFSFANTQNLSRPINGSPYHQGLPNDPSMTQNSAESLALHSGSSPAEVIFHSRANGSFPLLQNAETQNILPEHRSGGLMSSSLGKPMFSADKMNESSIDLRNKHQVHAKSPIHQSLQYGDEQLVHGLDNDPHQINLLLQSQQHFQGLQVGQQRSWGSLGQKHAMSNPSFSEGMHSLSQSTSTPDRNTSQSGTQQNLSSLGARNRSSGNDSYQSGRISTDNTAGLKQHQRFTTAGGAAPRRINMDGVDGKHSNSWSAIQPHQISQGAAYYSHYSSDAKHDICGNKAAQQAPHIVQDSFSSLSPSDSTQGVYNTTLDGRVPPMKIASCSSLSNEESFKLNQESGWKENTRSAVSEQTTLSLSESDRFSHGFWKRHASLQESAGALDTMCEPLEKVGSGSFWNRSLQQEKLVLEAQLDAQEPSNTPNSTSGQATAGRGTHETRFLRQEVSQQLQKQPDQVSSYDFASSVNAFSRGTTTMVSNDNNNGQIHQGFLVDEQRISQQHMHLNATKVSLAHLRHSCPSSPLSPQRVKLGLGPAKLPQNIQQAGSAGMRTSPLRNGLVRKGPTSYAEGKKFYTAPLYGGSVQENSVKSKADLNQGIHSQLNGVLLQNNGRPSSALSNSSSFSKESEESETLAPPSFPSAHLERSRVSQETLNSGGNSFCGSEDLQTGSLDDEPLASLQGKLSSASNPSRQPFLSAGDSEGKPLTGYRQANNDSGSLRMMQNQQIINMALKQLGNRTQTANIAGLLTTLKTSLSEHSKNSGGREKFFVESDQPQCSSAQKVDYTGGNTTQSMQIPQMISRKTNTGLEDGESVSVEHNNKVKQSSHTSQAGSASLSLPEDLLRRRRQSISLVNGTSFHSLHLGGHWEDEAEFMGSTPSNLVPAQADSQTRGAEASFALSGHSQYLQQQRSIILEGSPPHQTLKEPTPGAASAPTLPNLAVKAIGKLNEAPLKSSDGPPKHGYLPKVCLGHQDADALAEKLQYKSLMNLKEIQQQNAFDSEYLNQRGLQLPNPVARSVVNTNSSPLTNKGANSVVESDVEVLHKSRPHSGNSDDQVLPSQELRHENSSDDEKLRTLSHSSLANKQAQPAASDDQDTYGKDPYSKVEEAKPGIEGHIAVSNQLSQHQVPPSKTSAHDIVAVHPKKRKKSIPLLVPWHISASQPRSSLLSSSDAELTWANAANRLVDKDDRDVLKDNLSSGFKAKRRLKLTTQLMQQLIAPLPSMLMHGNSLVDNECATYSLAKLVLEDACRIIVNTQREAGSARERWLHGQQGRTWCMAKNVAVMRCVESFVEKAKRLDSEFARVESSTSVSELGREVYGLERMAIVNRLAKHHGTGLSIDSSKICLIENTPDVGTGIRKPSPKKYVTWAPMPKTLPVVKCLSL